MSADPSALVTVQTVAVPQPTLSRFDREERAFHRLLPELLRTHRGQYVVIHDEKPIDSDVDPVALTFRTLARLGNVDLYVGLVAETPPVARIPHVREARQEGPA
jgi:hypothetical protein